MGWGGVRCGFFWVFLGLRGKLTRLSVRICRIELLEWGPGVFLHEDHCVAAFVAGGYLDSGGFCEDI